MKIFLKNYQGLLGTLLIVTSIIDRDTFTLTLAVYFLLSQEIKDNYEKKWND